MVPSVRSTYVSWRSASGPGKENERAAVLALIDSDRGASRFMILIRGNGSFAYRGLYAVNVRTRVVMSGVYAGHVCRSHRWLLSKFASWPSATALHPHPHALV